MNDADTGRYLLLFLLLPWKGHDDLFSVMTAPRRFTPRHENEFRRSTGTSCMIFESLHASLIRLLNRVRQIKVLSRDVEEGCVSKNKPEGKAQWYPCTRLSLSDTSTFQFDNLAFHKFLGTIHRADGINFDCSSKAPRHPDSFTLGVLTSDLRM